MTYKYIKATKFDFRSPNYMIFKVFAITAFLTGFKQI